MSNRPWLLVLGANSDIARSVSNRYAKEGYNLYLASRNLHELEINSADISLRHNVEVKALDFDATSFYTHRDFYDKLSPRPFGVVVSFGFMANQLDAQKDFSLAKAIIDINYIGVVSILEVIASDFEKRNNQGFIVGISSVAGDRGRKSNYIYGSSKAGVTTYLSGLAHRLFKNDIHVLTVKPGFVNTKMTAALNLPKKLTASPEIVADAIFKAVNKRKSVIYVTPIWYFIMIIVKSLPFALFRKTDL